MCLFEWFEVRSITNLMRCSSGIKLGPWCNSSSMLHYILFADDTNIFYSSSQHEVLSIFISRELSKLRIWFALKND